VAVFSEHSVVTNLYTKVQIHVECNGTLCQ